MVGIVVGCATTEKVNSLTSEVCMAFCPAILARNCHHVGEALMCMIACLENKSNASGMCAS